MFRSFLKKLASRGSTNPYAGMGAHLSPEERARRAEMADDVNKTLDRCFFTIRDLAKDFTSDDLLLLAKLNVSLAATSGALQDAYPGLMKSPHRSPAASYIEAFANADWEKVSAYAEEIVRLILMCPQDPPNIRQNIVSFILSPMNILPDVRPTGGLFAHYSQD